MREYANLIGKRFGRLLVLSLDSSTSSGRIWRVQCDCGNERKVRTGKLTSGEHKSCGCLRSERLLEHNKGCRVLVIDGKKKCSKCKRNLPIGEFYKSKELLCGLGTRCRRCSLGYEWARKFGLSLEAADALLEAQSGTCRACKSTEDLHLDHNHDTGEIRGFLCGNCNRALGLLHDDPLVIVRLLKYLAPDMLKVEFTS